MLPTRVPLTGVPSASLLADPACLPRRPQLPGTQRGARPRLPAFRPPRSLPARLDRSLTLCRAPCPHSESPASASSSGADAAWPVPGGPQTRSLWSHCLTPHIEPLAWVLFGDTFAWAAPPPSSWGLSLRSPLRPHTPLSLPTPRNGVALPGSPAAPPAVAFPPVTPDCVYVLVGCVCV